MPKSDPADRTKACAEPIWHLLYRYLWPFPYFRDVTRGTTMERQQNYRYNRGMRVFLPGFIGKWAVLSILWYAFGGICDHNWELVLPAAACYMTASLTTLVAVKLIAAWLWLERFPELF